MNTKKPSCEMCGKCCHYEIPITLLDIHRIARYLNIPPEKVFGGYIQSEVSSRSQLFMIGKDEQRACVFLAEDKKCSIHSAKPKVCSFYVCGSDKESLDVIPWTASYVEENNRTELWEHSVASEVTKAYIRDNGTSWNDAAYYKAIVSIYENVVVSDNQILKLAKSQGGLPIGMIYDCSKCETRGEFAKETPVTLEDIRRITQHIGIGWKSFFQSKLDLSPSANTGGFKLKREKYCVFFDPKKHCTIIESRPMHCRFTPCSKRVDNEAIFSCLFLGSGTVEEQFRHQVALEITRQYVTECGAVYSSSAVKKYLKLLDNLVDDKTAFEEFCGRITPYRYVEDTLIH